MDTDNKIKEIIEKADFSKESDLKEPLLKKLLDLNRELQEKEETAQVKEKK